MRSSNWTSPVPHPNMSHCCSHLSAWDVARGRAVPGHHITFSVALLNEEVCLQKDREDCSTNLDRLTVFSKILGLVLICILTGSLWSSWSESGVPDLTHAWIKVPPNLATDSCVQIIWVKTIIWVNYTICMCPPIPAVDLYLVALYYAQGLMPSLLIFSHSDSDVCLTIAEYFWQARTMRRDTI